MIENVPEMMQSGEEMMALFIDGLEIDEMSVDVDGIDERRHHFDVKEDKVKRWKGR